MELIFMIFLILVGLGSVGLIAKPETITKPADKKGLTDV